MYHVHQCTTKELKAVPSLKKRSTLFLWRWSSVRPMNCWLRGGGQQGWVLFRPRELRTHVAGPRFPWPTRQLPLEEKAASPSSPLPSQSAVIAYSPETAASPSSALPSPSAVIACSPETAASPSSALPSLGAVIAHSPKSARSPSSALPSPGSASRDPNKRPVLRDKDRNLQGFRSPRCFLFSCS